MTEYMTEQEQIEQLKKWLKENGLTIIAGIVAALVMVSGWHFWQARHIRILSHASGIYDEMLLARSKNNLADVETQANRLTSHYSRTPYAQMATLMLARNAVINKNYPEAIKQLTWVVDHSGVAPLRQIAKIRIARIHIAENKPNEALAILDKVDDKTFKGLIAEVKGDAYVLMQNTAQAKESYQLALMSLPKELATQRPILQMKLDNLATSSNITA